MEEKMIDFSYKKEIGSTQVKTETRVETEGLQKILSISGEAMILSRENISGETKFNGDLCIEIVYIDNDNRTKSIRNLSEFEGKVSNDSITNFISPILKANILDIGGEQTGDNTLQISTIIEVNMYAFITESFKGLKEKNCITKSIPVNITEVIKSGEARINLEEGFVLKDKPDEILSVDARLLPKTYQSGTGYVQIDSYLIVGVVYTVNRDDKTEMRSEILRRDIKEEIEIDGITKDNKVVIGTTIKNCSIQTKNEGEKLTLNIPVDINYIVLSASEKDIVIDAFSSTNEVNMTYDTLTQITKLENYTTTERIDGEVEIDENQTRINRLLAFDGNRLVITNILTGDKTLKIEGIAYENIIYQLDDDTGTISSLNAEIPFSLQLNIPSISADDIVSARCEIIDCSNKLKRGRTIEIDNEIGINLGIVSQQYESVVKEVTLMEEIKVSDSNFIIYFAKTGDTLWDICKHLRVKEEQIMLQNKDLVFPLANDTTVVIYKKAENR